MCDVPHPEELTPAIHTGIMANRDLDHLKSCQFELLGHFNADDTASGFEGNSIEDVSPEQAEIAIHVANRQVENESHCAPVRCADPGAIPCIGSFHLVTVDEINMRPEFGQ